MILLEYFWDLNDWQNRFRTVIIQLSSWCQIGVNYIQSSAGHTSPWMCAISLWFILQNTWPNDGSELKVSAENAILFPADAELGRFGNWHHKKYAYSQWKSVVSVLITCVYSNLWLLYFFLFLCTFPYTISFFLTCNVFFSFSCCVCGFK